MSPSPFSIKTLFVLVDDRINNIGLFFFKRKEMKCWPILQTCLKFYLFKKEWTPKSAAYMTVLGKQIALVSEKNVFSVFNLYLNIN